MPDVIIADAPPPKPSAGFANASGAAAASLHTLFGGKVTSLADLERDGLVYSQRTNGRFVTENGEMIRSARFRMANERIAQFLADMQKLGCTREEIVTLLKEVREEEI